MRRSGAREHELRISSMKLGVRFMLWNTAALAIVMGLAALVLYRGATNIAENQKDDTLSRAVRVSFENPDVEALGATEAGQKATGSQHKATGVERYPVRFGTEGRMEGMLYRFRQEGRGEFRLVVPGGDELGRNMLGMIAGVLVAVILVGAGVALWVANQVSRPISKLVEDVRQIAKGDLSHKTRLVGTGEVELLARAIDRMTRDLEGAQEAHVELSVRERELDLATGVREALLPLATPMVPGFDLGALHVSSTSLGGDFHDFIERDDGCVGVLVCDVSGQGIPAALIGATARSYLRTELARTDDVLASFRLVNRWLAGDVRRGMFVTALYVLLDPGAGTAKVVSAGHKLPLLRYAAGDGKLRIVHPEGIALAFDKGPVFERRLEAADVPLEPGDRLFLSNSAPVGMKNQAGRELGEKTLYARVLKHAPQETTKFLKALRKDLEQFAGGALPMDVSLVTILREANPRREPEA